jgi:hypothetical protein
MSKYLDLIFGPDIANDLAGLNIESLGLDLKEMIGAEKIVNEEESENETEKAIEKSVTKDDKSVEMTKNVPSTLNNQGTKTSTANVNSSKQKKYKGKNNINFSSKFQELLKKETKEIKSSAPLETELFDIPTVKVSGNPDDELHLELLAVENGEKIYRLTDLFIPVNKSLQKKIENYNSLIINDIEKVEVEPKKEEQEKEEIKNLVKKAKKVQKYMIVNYSYNEKFFDKTFFLDNYNENTNLILHEHPPSNSHQAFQGYYQSHASLFNINNRFHFLIII